MRATEIKLDMNRPYGNALGTYQPERGSHSLGDVGIAARGAIRRRGQDLMCPALLTRLRIGDSRSWLRNPYPCRVAPESRHHLAFPTYSRHCAVLHARGRVRVWAGQIHQSSAASAANQP